MKKNRLLALVTAAALTVSAIPVSAAQVEEHKKEQMMEIEEESPQVLLEEVQQVQAEETVGEVPVTKSENAIPLNETKDAANEGNQFTLSPEVKSVSYSYTAPDDGIYVLHIGKLSDYDWCGLRMQVEDLSEGRVLYDDEFDFTGITMEKGRDYLITITPDEDARENICDALSIAWEQSIEDTYTVENGVLTEFKDHPFYRGVGYAYTANIVIPEGVTSISYPVYTRLGYASCGSIEFPSTIENIDVYSLHWSSRYKNYYVSDKNPVYASKDGVIYSKNGNVLVAYPSGRRTGIITGNPLEIGEYAFYENCQSVIELPDSVKTIQNSAFLFSGCEQVILGNHLEKIGSFAFSGCKSLESVQLPDSLKTVEIGAFEECSSLPSINLPAGLTSLERVSFSRCAGLKELKIDTAEVLNIADAFEECTALETFSVSEDNPTYSANNGMLFLMFETSYENERVNALELCSASLKGTVTVPDGVTEIRNAFGGRGGVTELQLPASLESWACYDVPFTLERISVDSDNPWFFSDRGVLYTRNMSLLCYPPSRTDVEYTLQKDTTWIRQGAFEIPSGAVRRLRDVYIPANVECFTFSEEDPWNGLFPLPDGGESEDQPVLRIHGINGSCIYEYYLVQKSCEKLEWVSEGSISTEITIHFKGNGGTCSVSEKAAKEGGTVGILPVPTRSGYQFLGWYTKASGGDKVTSDQTVIWNKDVTLYAHWKARKSIAGAKVTVASGTFANYKAVKPKTTVKLSGKALVNGTDYQLTFTNNTKPTSKAKVTVTGIGAYKGSITKYFKINQCAVTSAALNWRLKTSSYTYDGKAKRPAVIGNYGTSPLVKGQDYTCTYSNNVKIGTATVTIKGKGNYTGSRKLTYKINKAPQNISGKDSIQTTYKNIGKKYNLNVSNIKEKAKVTYSSNNKKVAVVSSAGQVTIKGGGSAVITVKTKATANYKATTKKIPVVVLKKQTITAKDFSIGYRKSPVTVAAKTNGNGALSYASNQTSVAKVVSGKLKLTGVGSTTITITAARTGTYAKATKKIKLTVTKGTPVINAEDLEVPDNSIPFKLDVSGESGKLSYAIDSTDIASVDAGGTVTLTGKIGSAVITISSAETALYKKGIKKVTMTVLPSLLTKIKAEKSKFPDGAFWNHRVDAIEDLTDKLNGSERFQDTISATPCKHHANQNAQEPVPGAGEYDCNEFDGAIQCDGFARKVFYDLWDGERVSQTDKIWGDDGKNVQIGDYVRIYDPGNPDTYEFGSHSAIVTGVDNANGTFSVMECNLDGDGAYHNCLIRHDWTYSKNLILYRVHAAGYPED